MIIDFSPCMFLKSTSVTYPALSFSRRNAHSIDIVIFLLEWWCMTIQDLLVLGCQ